MSEINELKVGDVRKFDEKYGAIFKIIAIGRLIAVIQKSDEDEECSYHVKDILDRSKPYQEPKPSPKLVAHRWGCGGVDFSFEGTLRCASRDKLNDCKRIELTPELLFGSEK